MGRHSLQKMTESWNLERESHGVYPHSEQDVNVSVVCERLSRSWLLWVSCASQHEAFAR